MASEPQISQIIRQAKPKVRFDLSEKQLEMLKTTSHVLLALGILAGTVAFTAVAPNIFKILDKLPWADEVFGPKWPRKRRAAEQEKKIRKAFYYLKSQGYIKLIPQGNDFLMKVTQKGRRFEKRMKFSELKISRPNSWDSGWWTVVADIPTPYKHRADIFREKLKEMKFFGLQRTVWLYPFDPRDEIDFASAYLNIDRFVTVMNVRGLDPDDEKVVKRFFKKEKVI